MSESEIRRGINARIESLERELANARAEERAYERLADRYWRAICVLTAERDNLQRRLNELEALNCRNPACQLCQFTP